MKKNISINLQGLIFHIEEDGYDVLSRYLAEVRAHFSGYRGHEEIVADIEGRIAELFAARTSSTKQVITLDDVQEMVGKMGRVSDFQSADEAEEEEEALAGGPEVYTNYAKAAGTATATAAATETEPKRLYRDMANRKIAGVAAGVARYFAINPLWIRLGFLAFLFLPPIVFDSHDGRHDFGGNLAALSFISYIILWIALPKKYDTISGDEDPTFKKLYRDTDNGKVGGVSAGLAAYFKVDVVLIRVLFVAFVFAGGFAIPLYIILWILLPEAKTVSDRMRMRGDALTLSSLDSTLRNNSFEDGADATSNNRPVGTFLEELFRNVRPLLNFLGTIVRIFIGVLMTVTGFGILLALVIALGVGLGMIPESQNIMLFDTPAYVMLNAIPSWSLLPFFLATAIPPLAMMLAGLGLLLRRSILSRTANLTMFGLWLLGLVGSSFAIAQVSRNFEEEAQVVQNQNFPALAATPSLFLDARRMDRSSSQWVDVELAAADSGAAVRVDKNFSANGPTEENARQVAVSSIAYTVRQSNDTTLLFDDHFTYRPGAAFRDQDVSLLVHLPRNKTFRISQSFASMLDDDDFLNEQRPIDAYKHAYRLTGNKLECLNCTSADLEDSFSRFDDEEDSETTDNDSTDTTVDINSGDENFRIRVNTDDDEDGNVGVDIDIDDKGFSSDPGRYGSARRTFNLKGFRTIEAGGIYRVYVRQGPEFKVEAAGEERDLRDLRVETDGDELLIRDRNRNSFFSGLKENHKPVLIRVQMPELTALHLRGISKANVAGFKDQALQVQQEGMCYAMLDVNVPRLDLDLSGASRTDLRGTANDLNVEGSGACQVQGLRMSTQTADFDLSGMSKARVRVANRLRAEVSGASRVEYAGSPSRVQKDVSGSSRVTRLKTKDEE
ncbi:PspC domain-containing protein [Hymenobacter chitinivorans]|uniref:Phage shock protein PspC (Stress-responsive transcriptional regulator) n=1 Tax=Hymenobacter chitinivorans DSM 11115 TaxID=1121954 RepID=A0A2M9BT10_9BACT|nr:PspC domain-containing protein [Hymenobacter chitinivorans]PJJ61085.1 phage shock protein PspC (stress-responsive transcriptional regulator) [Hymenobacter chitinivorans DSM 11115]